MSEIKSGIKLGSATFIIIILIIVIYSYFYRYNPIRLQNLLVNKYLAKNPDLPDARYSFNNIKYNADTISGDLVIGYSNGDQHANGGNISFDFKNTCDYIDIDCIIR
jgi:hypothetical protein